MKKISKYMALLLVLATIVACLSGCSQQNAASNTNTGNQNTAQELPLVRIGSLTGPTTLGLLKLYQDSDEGISEGNYEYTIAGTADELTPLVITGELDAICAPANLAAVLYSKTEGKIQMLDITTLGVLYILSQDTSVKGWEDLKGRTIYATGKGSTPEYVLNYLLEKNNLKAGEDVTIEFKSEPAEIVAQLNSGAEKEVVVMLPQPFATAAAAQVEGLETVMNLTEEWDKVSDGSKLITACLMVRKEFAEENPEAIELLIKEYTASAQWVNSNIDDAAKLAEEQIGIKEGVAKKAIPLCNIVSIYGDEMKASAEEYLKVLFDQNPASVGGKLPDNDFYYGAK